MTAVRNWDRPKLPILVVYTEVRGMAGRGIDPALRRNVERGQYEVDARAVAEAVLRSWMLVATQARDRATQTDKAQPATG